LSAGQGRGPQRAAMRNMRLSVVRFAVAAVLVCLAFAALAHDVPADARIQVFFRPEGNVLELLIRAPLAAMQEVDIPRRGPGYLDLPRAEPALRHAAQIWLIDNLEVYENERAPGAAAHTRSRLARI